MLSIDHLKGVSVAPHQFEVIRGALANQIDAVQTPDDSLAGTWPNQRLYSELNEAHLGRGDGSPITLDLNDVIHVAQGLVRQAESLENSRDEQPRTICGLIADRQARQKRTMSDKLIELCFDSTNILRRL